MTHKPITIALRSIHCLEETNEVGTDEPYVLVVAADFSPLVPNVEVVRYGPWEDVDKGEVHKTVSFEELFQNDSWNGLSEEVKKTLMSLFDVVVKTPFWGLDKQPKAIDDPNNIIFVVALVENDDGKPEVARSAVKATAVASLGASFGMERSVRVDKLINDVKDVLAIPTGFPNFDDRVGPPRELRISEADLQKADTLAAHFIRLQFQGDGGRYRLSFELARPLTRKPVALQASNGQYVCAEGGGGDKVVADRNQIHSWETFKLVDLGNNNIALQASNGQYVCAEGGGGDKVVADRDKIDSWETFKLVDLGNNNIALQASNGQYVCAEGGGGGKVVADRNQIHSWETFKLIML